MGNHKKEEEQGIPNSSSRGQDDELAEVFAFFGHISVTISHTNHYFQVQHIFLINLMGCSNSQSS